MEQPHEHPCIPEPRTSMLATGKIDSIRKGVTMCPPTNIDRRGRGVRAFDFMPFGCGVALNIPLAKFPPSTVLESHRRACAECCVACVAYVHHGANGELWARRHELFQLVGAFAMATPNWDQKTCVLNSIGFVESMGACLDPI